MIIGNVSVDPRKVVSFEYDSRTKIVSIDTQLGDMVRTIEAHFVDFEDADEAMKRLDAVCYKGPLADAISDKEIDEEDSDGTISDALIERLR